MILKPISFLKAASSGAYSASPRNFDAATYLDADSAQSTDYDEFVLSCWVRRADGTDTNGRFITHTGDNFRLWWSNNISTFQMVVKDTVGSTAVDYRGSGNAYDDTDWHHILVVRETTSGFMYIDDTSTGITIQTDSGNTMNTSWTAGNLHVGARSNATSEWDGDMADFRLWLGTSMSDTEANRRLFITSGGKPEDPADATASLGTPDIDLRGTDWETNQGSGTNFTETDGTLTAGTGPVEL